MGICVPIYSHLSFMSNCVGPLSKYLYHPVSSQVIAPVYLCACVLLTVMCVLMFLHICEHAPTHLREEPVWEPGECTLAEERHTLETNLRPCGQVGVGQSRPVSRELAPQGHPKEENSSAIG